MSNSLNRRHLLWLLPVSAVALSGSKLTSLFKSPPKDLDLSFKRLTDNGLYIGTLEPSLSPIRVGKIHSWIVKVTTANGKPVEHAAVSIDGGMPQHGHGLPTKPKVTGELGGGRYQVEGMKFNMRGWWTIDLGVDGPNGTDSVTFNLML